MKKHIFLLTLFCASMVLSAQIGINTEVPQQLFHVDAQRNTSGSSQISDDVVVDSNGNMGIGILSPTAKLDIRTNGSTPGMRIVDGTQGNTRILRSDALGNTSWVNQPSSGGVIYNLTGRVVNYPRNVSSLVIAMPITESGNYLVTIRWWGMTTGVQGTNETSAYFMLDDGVDNSPTRGTNKDQIEYYVRTFPNNYFSFTTCLYANIQAGRWLKLFIAPSAGSAASFNWVIGTPATDNLHTPSIELYKI